MAAGEPEGGSGGGSLPSEIVQSIAISNAKSIGEQPAILANLALANQILNNNLQQQIAISQQQAMNQVIMATMSKCVALISENNGPASADVVKDLLSLIKQVKDGGSTAPNAPPNPPPKKKGSEE